ncbi:MAG: aspartate/glutamate racemase family protein, partial [Desulfitobacterium hafniense]
PGAKAAIQATATGNIGLIATEATVRSQAYSSAVRRILSKRRGGHAIELVKAQACPLFVPLVEAGLSHSPEARGIARTYLAPIQEAQVDALILGCTHYPFLAPVIQEILGEEIILVDPAQAMTEELKEVLKQLEYNRESGQETHKAPGHHRFFVSGDPVLFERVGNTLLPGQIHDVNQVNWNG